MIYANHAGTSWPKPAVVGEACSAAMGLDPSGWPDLFQSAHRQIADFYHVDSSRLLLTPGCTSALSIAVADHPWQPGDRVITSHYEHHALQRPLTKLQEFGVEICTLPSRADELIDVDDLRKELARGRVRLVALTAACNVTGQLLPIVEVAGMAHEFGAYVLIDGAQVAGWWDLDLIQLNADLFTIAGHKGPQAPWGIGALYVSPDVSLNSPLATCDVGAEASPSRCTSMPGYCDAGSVNLVALTGMATAAQWLADPKRLDRLEQARAVAARFAEAIRGIPEVKIYGDVAMERKMPTVAFTVAGHANAKLIAALRTRGVIASAGTQCAPQAHRALGTGEGGVMRFSFGGTSSLREAFDAAEILQQIVSK